MTLQPGDTIDGGKYRIVRLLGEGGMGAVYEGENTRIQRRVAIKVLHGAIAAKADVVQRFEREAQAAGRIGSEHIVEVLDLGSSPDGERYMVMEFLEGESLGDRLRRRGRVRPEELAGVMCQLLAGLGAAHAAGIVHRDLKPDNVFLVHARAGQRDFVKILDFGVSKFAALESDLSMTKTGAVVGTPFYMSPEQARGQEVDARSDLFSAGVVAYQAVTGQVPFNAATFNELVFKIALEAPAPAESVAPDLDPAFAAIIARAMARDPAARFQTAGDMAAAVADWAASAGVTLPATESAMPAGIAGAMRGQSAADLGLAKTLSTEGGGAGASRRGGSGRGRVIAVAVAATLIAGAAAGYMLLGGQRPHVAATPPISSSAASPPSAAPTATAAASAAPAVMTAAPSVTGTATASAAPPRVSVKHPAAKASAQPVAPVAPVAPAGRTINSDL